MIIAITATNLTKATSRTKVTNLTRATAAKVINPKAGRVRKAVVKEKDQVMSPVAKEKEVDKEKDQVMSPVAKEKEVEKEKDQVMSLRSIPVVKEKGLVMSHQARDPLQRPTRRVSVVDKASQQKPAAPH